MRAPAYSQYTKEEHRHVGTMDPEIEAKVCICWEPGNLVRLKHISVCSKCMLPESYYVFICSGCGKSFLHDFIDQFCYKEPGCWDCLSIDKPTPCTGHIYCDPYTAKVRPPFIVGKKRQVVDFTEEVPAFIL